MNVYIKHHQCKLEFSNLQASARQTTKRQRTDVKITIFNHALYIFALNIFFFKNITHSTLVINCYLTECKLHATLEQYKTPQAFNSSSIRLATG